MVKALDFRCIVKGDTIKSLDFEETNAKMGLDTSSFIEADCRSLSPKCLHNVALDRSLSFKQWGHELTRLEIPLSFKRQSSGVSGSVVSCNGEGDSVSMAKPPKCPVELVSLKSIMDPEAAAVKVQKVYKGYRTRRNLADGAVVAEEVWWQAYDYLSLNHSSVSFFDVQKQESAHSRWSRARTRAAKVGKGLSKDSKAQKLALRHWLEAIDPRHRYGHNLHQYYYVWFHSESTQPFFYWLDIGDGKELSLDRCPRQNLQHQCIKYLGPIEREAFEVIVSSGKLVYKRSELLVETDESSKWIFVLSTSRNLYIGKKKKGKFQHSSFLAGAATTAAGRLVAKEGVLMAIWPYSGHYLPTEENFKEFINFLKENNVDLTNVKKCAVDDDEYPSSRQSETVDDYDDEYPTFRVSENKPVIDEEEASDDAVLENRIAVADLSKSEKDRSAKNHDKNSINKKETLQFEISKPFSCNWTTGAGPRIGCLRDYPTDVQCKALEQVNLSPRPAATPTCDKVPIPSPRPGRDLRLSPRIACMGIASPRISTVGHILIPSPRVALTLPMPRKR